MSLSEGGPVLFRWQCAVHVGELLGEVQFGGMNADELEWWHWHIHAVLETVVIVKSVVFTGSTLNVGN